MKKLASIVISMMAIAVAATPATASDANGNHDRYTWIVGATTPSDTAVAPDGATITMTGGGTLMAGPGGTATGGGTFTTSTNVTGNWKATAVDGFVSYGPAGPKFPPGFTGGEAKLRVTLDRLGSGVLTVICVLGSPPAGKMEGIQLVLGSGVGGEYTKQVPESGNTVFIKT